MNRKQFSTLAAIVAGCAAIGVFNGLVYADVGHAGKKHARNVYHGEPCVGYEVHSYGGDAGLRFMHNIGNYTLVKNGVARGKLCHAGPTTVEISRRHPHTRVVLLIGGERYVFHPHEPPHQYINHWHRKYVKLHSPGQAKAWKRSHKYRYRGNNDQSHGHWRRHAHHHHRHWW